VSGPECVRALHRAGFDVALSDADHTLIQLHGAPIVRVPLVDKLRPGQLVAILRLTGLTPSRFALLLE
jgi:hypothetical protein